VLVRTLAVALLAGFIASTLVSAVQMLRVMPLILEAEVFEAADHSEHAADGATWSPEDGVGRTAYTIVANLLVGLGFGLLLVGAFVLAETAGRSIDAFRGFLWGLAGFPGIRPGPLGQSGARASGHRRGGASCTPGLVDRDSRSYGAWPRSHRIRQATLGQGAGTAGHDAASSHRRTPAVRARQFGPGRARARVCDRVARDHWLVLDCAGYGVRVAI
jgi:hypothetical protein